MGGLILSGILLFVALAALFIPFPKELLRIKKVIAGGAFGACTLVLSSSAFGYNDAGFQTHVRTIFSTESAVMDTGWYFAGWGISTTWPKFITVVNTANPDAVGNAVNAPYRVRLADNWTGDVTQSTIFQIPNDPVEFVEMSKTFRTLSQLVNSTLIPDVNASIDSVANMFTMEEYYSGGQRDQFKTEFYDTITKGRAMVRQISLNQSGGIVPSRARPNDDEATENLDQVGDTDVRQLVMEKILDQNGEPIRRETVSSQYGITVSQAILEGIDPDDEYENQIIARKAASSRRVVAREQRLEQEEQRLLAIQTGATDIARRQATAQVEQIEQTTGAETQKQLVLIAAGQRLEQAEFARETAVIDLERARIEAESVTVAADAEAYAKEAILLADGALAQKLDAWVQAQTVWAAAAATINVPSTVFNSGSAGGEGGTTGNALGTVDQFMQMIMIKTAQDLQVDPTIRN